MPTEAPALLPAPRTPLRRLNAVAAEGALATVVAFALLHLFTALDALPAFGIAASLGMIAVLAGMSIPWPRQPLRPGLARIGGLLVGAGNVAFVLFGVFGTLAFDDAAAWLAWLAPGAAASALGLAALHLAARP